MVAPGVTSYVDTDGAAAVLQCLTIMVFLLVRGRLRRCRI
jgi:hypothetical protein